MLEELTLDYYKNYLVNYFFNECDNNKEKRMERRRILEKRLSDDFILEVINNTKEFYISLLEKNIKDGVISFNLTNDLKYIFTNCTGGYHPDVLFVIDELDEEKYISKYLLELCLGKICKTYFDTTEMEYIDDENGLIVGCIYELPKIVIVGDFSSLNNFENINYNFKRILKK